MHRFFPCISFLSFYPQDCKIQNTIREYCKIFAAEARVIENFGFSLEYVMEHNIYTT